MYICSMWTYKKQLIIRWLSFFFGMILFAYLIVEFRCAGSSLTFREMIKSAVVNFSTCVQSMPDWSYVLGFIVSVVLMCFGVPSILFFGFLLISYNLYVAFFVTFLAQVISTRICMRIAYHNYENRSEDLLCKMSDKLKDKSVSFAFWSRVYFTFPLRTIDSLVPAIHNENENLNKEFFAASRAIFLRLIIPSLWFNSVFKTLTALDFNSSIEKNLYFWSSALLVYSIIPRAPELIICPDEFKNLLFKIAPYKEAEVIKKPEKKSKNLLEQATTEATTVNPETIPNNPTVVVKQA